jgi:hypothetical protein
MTFQGNRPLKRRQAGHLNASDREGVVVGLRVIVPCQIDLEIILARPGGILGRLKEHIS